MMAYLVYGVKLSLKFHFQMMLRDSMAKENFNESKSSRNYRERAPYATGRRRRLLENMPAYI